MLNAAEATAALNALPTASDKPREERAAIRQANRVAEGNINKEFRAYLEDTYGYNHTPEQHEKLWAAAWSNGHAHGYQNVEVHYSDYTDLTDEELEELDD